MNSNNKCKYNLTEKNCTYYPEFRASCPDNCPNIKRSQDYNDNSVSFKDKLKSLPEDMLFEFAQMIRRYPISSTKSLWVSIVDTFIE